MGRPKKLPVIEILDGNPTKRAIEAGGVECLGEPYTPEHLQEDARGCLEVIRLSMPPRVYSALDTFLLSAFAAAWALHKKAAEQIAHPDFQFIIKTKRGPSANPWLAILNAQASQMTAISDRLGLDPKSRASLKLPNARDRQSKFSGLIGQARLSNSSKPSPSLPASDKESPSN